MNDQPSIIRREEPHKPESPYVASEIHGDQLRFVDQQFARISILFLIAMGLSAVQVVNATSALMRDGKSVAVWENVFGILLYADVGFIAVGAFWYALVWRPSKAKVNASSACFLWAILSAVYLIGILMGLTPVKGISDIGGFAIAASYLLSTLMIPFALYMVGRRFLSVSDRLIAAIGTELLALSVIAYHGVIWLGLFTVRLYG